MWLFIAGVIAGVVITILVIALIFLQAIKPLFTASAKDWF